MSSAQGLCEALCFRLLCNDSIIWGTFVWQPNTDVEREPLVELSPAHCFVLCPEKGCIVGRDKLYILRVHFRWVRVESVWFMVEGFASGGGVTGEHETCADIPST